VPPRKGARHALRLIRDVFVHKPVHPETNLQAGFDFLNKILHRRALIFVFSDFVDVAYERSMQRTAHRHDVVAVTIADPREDALPAVGLLEIHDPESGQKEFQAIRDSRRFTFQQWCRAHQIDILSVTSAGRHLDGLMRFFEQRERRLKHP
jgi:uncharacterized protein (DUF58 family)